MADLTHLDSQSLLSFADGELAQFIDDLKRVSEGNFSVHGLVNADMDNEPDLIGAVLAGKPLVMGKIDDPSMVPGTPDIANGGLFADALTSNLTTIDDTVAAQLTTFEQIDETLRDTITELLKTQDTNLATIGAEAFTEILSESGLSSTASTYDTGTV